MTTLYEKLLTLQTLKSHLKPGATLEKPDAIAAKCGDNDTVPRHSEARTKLFQLIDKTQQRAA